MKLFGFSGGRNPYDMDRLETFQKAKDAKAKAIHIEVWMTVDQKLIVLKCGSNGEFEESADGKKEIIYVENLNSIQKIVAETR